MPRQYGILHITLLFAVGIAGWAALIVLTINTPSFFTPLVISWKSFACLFLVVLARWQAVRFYRRLRIALDSAFYIATRFIFGTIFAGWLMALTLTIDAIVRLLRGRGPVPREEAPLRYAIAYSINNGGLPCLTLLILGAIFGDTPLTEQSVNYTWELPLFMIGFLAIHYFGSSFFSFFETSVTIKQISKFYKRAVSVELLLVPLALAMVMFYAHEGIWLFLLLGTTGLLFNSIFRRATIASTKLRERVVELSVLNKVGHLISTSHSQQTLFSNLATTTLSLLERGSLFLIGILDDYGENLTYEVFNNKGDCIKQIVAPRNAGLSGYVVSTREGLILSDLQHQYHRFVQDITYTEPEFHSWLGVPLIAQNEVVGVLAVQSKQKNIYTVAHMQVLAIIADQAAIAIENSRLFQLATIDGLTGLFVRRYFDQRLVEEWDRTQRYNNSFSLGIFDLDHFKKFNDTYGHQLGDQALRIAGRVVRNNMRSFDIAARYGGEEFAFILPRTGINDAVKVAERIRKDVEQQKIKIKSGYTNITASIGLVAGPINGITDAYDLLTLADKALYKAKNSGRNRVVIEENNNLLTS